MSLESVSVCCMAIMFGAFGCSSQASGLDAASDQFPPPDAPREGQAADTRLDTQGDGPSADCVPGQLCDGSVLPTCDNTTLAMKVSADGIQEATSIALPVGIPTKYYVHVTAGGVPCEVNFDVQVSTCQLSGTGCSAWNEVKPWGNWRSNAQGIARVDLDSGWGVAQIVRFKVAKAGTVATADSTVSYSNECQLRFDPAVQPTTRVVNFQDFIVMVPGYAYVFDNTYSLYAPPKTGRTYLQMEAKTIIGGITTVPWRFTKSNPYAYWGNRLPLKFNDDSAVLFDGMRDLRWFIVEPSFSYAAKPAYDQYVWGYGDKRYARAPGVGMENVLSDANDLGAYVYGTSNPVPGYNLGRKSLEVPYIEANPADHWKVRAEFETIAVKNNAICGSSSCEALRMDYYEGSGFYENDISTMSTENWFHRESWYFVKGIGLVKILGQGFNKYGNTDVSVSPRCFDASNCWADTMVAPHRIVELVTFSRNPNPLSIAVSSDDVTYSSTITVVRGAPYYLKVSNVPDYTGYLAATAGKWPVWFEDGKATVQGSVTATLAAGLYEASFRMWIPDDAFGGETRITTNNLQLSNKIAVNLVDP